MPDKTIFFCFGLHHHQPAGNFDFVFEEAYQKAYRPFLDVFERHDGLRITQHYTGILLDWFADNHPGFLDRLGRLVDAGRVELLGGGYYEPILPMLPQRDRIGQIQALNEKIRSLFGREPRGAWVAERVWEPFLAGLFADCGIEYVLLDDAHFRMAGIPKNRMRGPFVTEDEGKTVSVFPISQTLRYLIPFHPVEETLAYLDGFPAEENESVCVAVADDGEKFGIWPGTHDSVYGEGWLERFLTALEQASGWLRVTTFSEALDRVPSQGLVYLPAASYSEMMDWALPAEETQAIGEFRASLDPHVLENYGRFIKGGFWRSFLSKYREVQQLHRKMLAVSERVSVLPDSPARKKALRHLWKAQCNCGYWHGVFGGIYLNHIRAENYRNLILAEKRIDRILGSESGRYRFKTFDFFRDGGRCLRVRTPASDLLFDLDAGGMLVEWDDLDSGYNLMNTLTRRPEAYHREITRTPGSGSEGSAVSIHELHVAKEEGLSRFLVYDPYRRAGNIPHFFSEGLSLETFLHAPHLEENTFPKNRVAAAAETSGKGCRITLDGTGSVLAGSPHRFRLRQEWTFQEKSGTWSISTILENIDDTPWKGFFGLEFGWSFNTGAAPDRFYVIDGKKPSDALLGSVGMENGVRRLELVEGWWQVHAVFDFEDPARLWRFPIETVSSSESGFERVYQSSVVIPSWPVRLAPREQHSVSFRLRAGPVDSPKSG